MRHSTTHLAIALCATMAVSSAPVSPNPISPALVTPNMGPENEARDLSASEFNSPVPQKRSVGGFAYHTAGNNEIEKRANEESDQLNEKRQVPDFSDSEGSTFSASDSEFDNDVGSASDGGIQQRSVPEIWTRSPPLSPQESVINTADFDDNASIASADDFMSVASDNEGDSVGYLSNSEDDNVSVISDFVDTSKNDVSLNAKAVATDTQEIKDGKLQARRVDMGTQSGEHGGRNYVNFDSWKA